MPQRRFVLLPLLLRVALVDVDGGRQLQTPGLRVHCERACAVVLAIEGPRGWVPRLLQVRNALLRGPEPMRVVLLRGPLREILERPPRLHRPPLCLPVALRHPRRRVRPELPRGLRGAGELGAVHAAVVHGDRGERAGLVQPDTVRVAVVVLLGLRVAAGAVPGVLPLFLQLLLAALFVDALVVLPLVVQLLLVLGVRLAAPHCVLMAVEVLICGEPLVFHVHGLIYRERLHHHKRSVAFAAAGVAEDTRLQLALDHVPHVLRWRR
mmetsp:Transcript_35348/g.57771  ORF Transcript_35348/g.57771 Transcript_35348/m.57771 type:complete len:266 (+) Transcript_35348:169-966(+)